MSNIVLDFKLLAAVISEIRVSQLTGILSVSKKEQSCLLFFKQGQLINATKPTQDEVGDEVLYDVLNWEVGELEWQPQTSQTTAHTIDDDQQSTFFTTLSLLQKQGKFDSKPSGWLVQKNQANSDTPTTTKLSALKPLLMLPGENSLALQQQLNDFTPSALVAELQHRFFSGYVTYTLKQASPSRTVAPVAMLLFENGELTAIRYTQPELDSLSGQAAFDAILNNQAKLVIDRITGVERGVMTAFRGLVEGVSPYSKVPATQNNYNGLVAAFARQQRSGVIHLYMDSQIEIFYMFDSGRSIASFGPQPLRPLQLRLLTPDLNSFWNKPNAFIDVYLTGSPAQIDYEVVSFKNSAINIDLMNLLSQSLLQLFELVCQFTNPKSAFDQLLAVVGNGSRRYPLLSNVGKQLVWNENTGLRQISLVATATTDDTIAAYEYLLNCFLKPYIEKMGLEIFRQLAELALGENAAKLSNMNFQLDFLTNSYYKSPIVTLKQGELIPASPNWQEEGETRIPVHSSEESAFDF